VALGDEDASRAAARAADRSGTGPVDPEIMAALAGLPERQRQVIALRIFVDMDTAAAAQTLGIAPGTVTAHLARAIATLRAQLSPHPQQGRQ
jgi:DNA-directed RNA polymerase specialized sigma24 family protein